MSSLHPSPRLRLIRAGHYTPGQHAANFLREVSLIFQEEHVAYRSDDRGVVRYTVDQQFEQNRAATLAGLEQSRFANAASNFDEASKELSKTPSDEKGAIRATFDAAESVFKVMF